MVYEDVTRILEENDAELIERTAITLMICATWRLAEILRNKRMRRGSIDFDLDETKITLDLKGNP
jgi:ribonuclease R